MSASPQGPDWWQASDLRWYPPSMQPAQPVLPSPPQAPEARLVTAPTTLHTGERTSAQVLRNAVVFVALLVAIAGAPAELRIGARSSAGSKHSTVRQ